MLALRDQEYRNLSYLRDRATLHYVPSADFVILVLPDLM